MLTLLACYRIMHDNYAFLQIALPTLNQFARALSQEGRVHIMKTSHIEHLDEEIIRLGLG